MNKWWWLTAIVPSAGITKAEGFAGGALWGVVAAIYLLLQLPEYWLLNMLGVETGLEMLIVTLLSLLPAVLLARPILEFVASELIERGDEANAKRMAARKQPE